MPTRSLQHPRWLDQRPTNPRTRPRDAAASTAIGTNRRPNRRTGCLGWRCALKWFLIVLKWVVIVLVGFSLMILGSVAVFALFVYLGGLLEPAISHTFDRWSAISPTGLDLSQCKIRVDGSQTILFDPRLYFQQYNVSSWNPKNIPDYEHNCASGFSGNPDIYGLGIRLGLYLQWVCSLVANCFFKDLRQTMVPSNMLFALALVAALFQMAVQDSCNFVVEVEITMLLFLGCFMALRILPNLMDSGSSPKRSMISWQYPLSRLLYTMVLWYGGWFFIFGYDSHFAKMPCGTTHFMLGLVSEGHFFNLLRLWIGCSLGISAVFASILIPATALSFPKEIWTSISNSTVVQGIFPGLAYEPLLQTDSEREQHPGLSSKGFWRRCLTRFKLWLRDFTGIGLTIEPVPERKRRYYIAMYLALYTFLLIHCVTGIELTIRSNRITGVNTVNSVGQYVALTIGLGTTIVFIYSILKQLLRRRSPNHVQQDEGFPEMDVEMNEQQTPLPYSDHEDPVSPLSTEAESNQTVS